MPIEALRRRFDSRRTGIYAVSGAAGARPVALARVVGLARSPMASRSPAACPIPKWVSLLALRGF